MLIKHQHKSKGAVFVEFALVLVFLVSLIILTIDVSYALYEYQTLVKQARAGARYLSVQPHLAASDPGTPTIKLKASCLVRTAKIDSVCAYTPLLSQLSDSNLVIINDSETVASLKSLDTSSALPGNYSTTVNLIEVRIEGYVHHLMSGLTDIKFSPIVARMRQTN